jgi:UDP-2-acetamido-3-amino-2,3-dideoxy-glucuronate N-acetyltransferase
LISLIEEKRPKFSLIKGAKIGKGTVIHDQVNLYRCTIGKNCKIDAYVYIEEGVKIGDNCKIRPFVFIPTGVSIRDNVFIGPGVVFTNDKHPRAHGQWTLLKTEIQEDASVGARSVILPGVTVGKGAIIGAGSVVTKDVPEYSIVAGNPARILRHLKPQ